MVHSVSLRMVTKIKIPETGRDIFLLQNKISEPVLGKSERLRTQVTMRPFCLPSGVVPTENPCLVGFVIVGIDAMYSLYLWKGEATCSILPRTAGECLGSETAKV